MAPVEETIWDLDEHTQAKHEILKNYLGGWFPILARHSGRIVYIDGFAGPGVYSKGEEGSPIIALRTATQHLLKPHKWSELVFVFIEKDKKRAESLNYVIKEKFPELPKRITYSVITDEFEPALHRIFDGLDSNDKKLAPTFAFIDPFGFSGFSMDLMKRLLSYDKCEVLITFMAGFIRRFLDELREPVLDNLYGTQDWREIRNVKDDKLPHLLKLYEDQLTECCEVKYTRSFEMISKHNQVLYFLIFATKHWLGLKLMKEAMWRVDKSGNFSFSDRLGRAQSFLMDYQEEQYWIPKAAKRVYANFKGKTVRISDIEQFVVTETEYIFRKKILRYIEKNNPSTIEVQLNRKRRKGSFPDDSIIQFI